jgi:hypothetical protein
MADYIEKNTRLRMKSKDEFSKNFFKLMNNSVYGKTLENVRGYSNYKVCNEEQFTDQVKKPTYKGYTKISDNLIITNNNKEKIQFNKPIFLGCAVLDLSKYLMYDFLYNYIKPKYGNNARLCFSDTDSLFMEIKTNDVYKDMEKDKNRFDLSDYGKNPDTAFLKDNTNKKVLGKMKDEEEGNPVREYVGLRPKMYSYLKDSGENENKAKGIKKAVIKKQLSHQKYLNSLEARTAEQIKSEVNFKTITSFKHRVFTENCKKSALSPLDDKRWILNDGITTRALGHKNNR